MTAVAAVTRVWVVVDPTAKIQKVKAIALIF